MAQFLLYRAHFHLLVQRVTSFSAEPHVKVLDNTHHTRSINIHRPSSRILMLTWRHRRQFRQPLPHLTSANRSIKPLMTGKSLIRIRTTQRQQISVRSGARTTSPKLRSSGVTMSKDWLRESACDWRRSRLLIFTTSAWSAVTTAARELRILGTDGGEGAAEKTGFGVVLALFTCSRSIGSTSPRRGTLLLASCTWWSGYH